ncbi:Uncharacterized conserved protein, DUF2164 family [Halobacillus karajensis]|uniref:DUF2164 domain-containing protein n=1 Tax=Halobacillus karajensis TaxID=195088 RepID=A0A024P9P9_9BACI|nr:DUF2164 domain-containing protein [Halobacillus karajensis]CDQ21527.1 hypothetical protein BN982_03929 [Halobacillus karajensis]CDQ25461.1 hypothetical protein BN983_03807 [Halobacillus karajensis]CDQ29008.1 hypothetical protein BN981_03352 [Halobacillus karajensis]SEI09259.1 Uncharacterized conserved protein, DUF2164 family [Halobacillus karajensis]
MKLKKDEKAYMVERVKEYFELEQGEVLGDLAAEQWVHRLAEDMGPFFYNKGVDDARQMVEQKVMNVDEDLRSLERPAGKPTRR